MPNITIEGPRIKDLDIKRELVREVTELAHKAYRLPKDVIVVVIKENAPEHVSGGEATLYIAILESLFLKSHCEDERSEDVAISCRMGLPRSVSLRSQ